MAAIYEVANTTVAFNAYETEGGGVEVQWQVPTLDINLGGALTAARRTDAVKVPSNFSTIAHLNVRIFDAATPFIAWVYGPDQSDSFPGTSAPLGNFNAPTGAAADLFQQIRVRTSSTGTIAARLNGASPADIYSAATMGFTWSRRS